MHSKQGQLRLGSAGPCLVQLFQEWKFFSGAPVLSSVTANVILLCVLVSFLPALHSLVRISLITDCVRYHLALPISSNLTVLLHLIYSLTAVRSPSTTSSQHWARSVLLPLWLPTGVVQVWQCFDCIGEPRTRHCSWVLIPNKDGCLLLSVCWIRFW